MRITQLERQVSSKRAALAQEKFQIKRWKGALEELAMRCQKARLCVQDTKTAIVDIHRESLKQAQADWMGLVRKAAALEKEHRHTQDKLRTEEKQAKDRLKALEDQYAGKVAEMRRRLEERKRTLAKFPAQVGKDIEDATPKTEENTLFETSMQSTPESPTKPVVTETSNGTEIERLSATAKEEVKSAESQSPVLPRSLTLAESPVQNRPFDTFPNLSPEILSQSPVSTSPATDQVVSSAPLIRTLSYKQPPLKSKFSLPARVSSANELDIESFLGSAASSLLSRNKK